MANRDQQPALLVGNGPNRLRTEEGNPDWVSLLRDLSKRAGFDNLNPDGKPLPLVFEEVLGRAVRGGRAREDDLKEHVAEVSMRIKANWAHDKLRTMPVRDILTTNYDYALIRTGADAVPGLGSTETKYSLFRVRDDQRQRIWQVHGEALKPASILLGYDHYVRYAGRIQDYFSNSRRMDAPPSSEKWMPSNALSPLAFGDFDLDEMDPSKRGTPRFSWVDLFLTRTVFVFGLGLDFSEVVFWWLLAVRARKEERRRLGVSEDLKPPGRVVWWHVGDDPKDERFRSRREVAEGLGATVRFFKVDGHDYEAAYRQVLPELRAAITAA